jgi:hypothetical protein
MFEGRSTLRATSVGLVRSSKYPRRDVTWSYSKLKVPQARRDRVLFEAQSTLGTTRLGSSTILIQPMHRIRGLVRTFRRYFVR